MNGRAGKDPSTSLGIVTACAPLRFCSRRVSAASSSRPAVRPPGRPRRQSSRSMDRKRRRASRPRSPSSRRLQEWFFASSARVLWLLLLDLAPPDPVPDAGAAPPPPAPMFLSSSPSPYVLTRLHVRYGKSALGNDLVFRTASAIAGGREVWNASTLEKSAHPDATNNFQARYAMRHAWTGPIACRDGASLVDRRRPRRLRARRPLLPLLLLRRRTRRSPRGATCRSRLSSWEARPRSGSPRPRASLARRRMRARRPRPAPHRTGACRSCPSRNVDAEGAARRLGRGRQGLPAQRSRSLWPRQWWERVGGAEKSRRCDVRVVLASRSHYNRHQVLLAHRRDVREWFAYSVLLGPRGLTHGMVHDPSNRSSGFHLRSRGVLLMRWQQEAAHDPHHGRGRQGRARRGR